MSPDDPRHGRNAGYIKGCRLTCCKTAHAKYKRDRRTRLYLARGPLSVSGLGARRRVEALMCLGWSMEEISLQLGHHRSWCHQMMAHDVIYLDTHERMAALYDRWCMSFPPPKPIRSRIRNMARNRGYAPPLAWDDIDDPNERPKARLHPKAAKGCDEAVVLRVLAGENLPTTKAERDEIMRRWVAGGGSRRAICARFGWHDDRYAKEAKAS